MDKVRIGARTDDVNLGLELKKLLPDASIAFLRSQLASGQPFIEFDFFELDHEEQVERARALVTMLQAKGLEPIIYEDDKPKPISTKFLLNTFKSWAEDERQRKELQRLGHRD